MVDRALLEQYLEEGLSLAAIGQRQGRHESTVAYWMAKHGLAANGRARHAAKGAVGRQQLEELVRKGLSSTQIAELLGRTPTTIRYWLREYGLQTRWAERRQGREMDAVS